MIVSKHKISRIFIILTISLAVNVQAQVSIGESSEPQLGALLDLKSDDKGLLMPRVSLNDPTSLKPMLTDLMANDADSMKLHTGLTVYNTTNTNGLCEGVYTWTGSRWEPWPSPPIIRADELSNCFIVPNGVYLDIPVKKVYDVWNTYEATGFNSPKEDMTGTLTAELIWQDKEDLISNTSASQSWMIPVIGDDENALIRVLVNSGCNVPQLEGNALVSLRINGVIRWSWHLWVTDYNPDNPVSPDKTFFWNNITTKGDYVFMDRNLGATSPEQGNESNMGMYYQWGRNNPFPPEKYYNGNDRPAVTGKYPTRTNIPVTTTNHLADAIKNPNYFYTNTDSDSFQDWYTNSNITDDPFRDTQNSVLWDNFGEKTPFDPCPLGWRIPFNKNRLSPWEGMQNVTATWETGYQWQDVLGYYPAQGGINSAGQVSNLRINTHLWSGTTINNEMYTLRIFSTFLNSSSLKGGGSVRVNGHPVRCIKD